MGTLSFDSRAGGLSGERLRRGKLTLALLPGMVLWEAVGRAAVTPVLPPFTTVLANGPGHAGEWVGLYRAGTAGLSGYVDWQWTSGTRTGPTPSVNGTLTWPTAGITIAPGQYVLRWWSPTSTLVAESAVLTLTAPAPMTP